MNNDKTPKISVIMSVYNSEKFLREAIDSILDQSFSDFEFIITDDCSTDNSLKILKEYSIKDDRIVLLKNSENIGLTKNLNRMLDIAKGKYIARMDADDISLSNRFEMQFDFMENNPEIGVLGSNIRYFGMIDRITNHPLEHNEIKVGLLFKCVMNHPSIIFRKEVIDKHNFRYDENFKISQDYELWSRMIYYTKFANLKDVLVDYRFESSNITNTHKDEYKNKLLRKIFISQLQNLNIDLQKIELDPFNVLSRDDNLTTIKEVATTEKLLFKIVENSVKYKIYNESIIKKRISKAWFH
ncbi:MAG: glycosyltransferase, partial [Candidatus Delongbacteria bacterium]|nr:glycosyltransferase [Candidatus Delongbacteria bacterium]